MSVEPCKTYRQAMMNYIMTNNLPGSLRDHIMGCNECRAFESDCHDRHIQTNQEVDRILKIKPKERTSLWRIFLPLILLVSIAIVTYILSQ